MKKAYSLLLLIALLALSLPGHCAEGISNTFGINNTVGATRPLPPSATASSPYTDNAYQLRGQVHAHSRGDFGEDYVSDNVFADLYRGLGYDFLALTNHHTIGEPRPISPQQLSPSWSGWVPGSVEMTYGDGHLIVLGTAEGTTVGQLEYDSGSDVEKMAERIQKAHDCQALAFIAHPSSWPKYGVTVDDLNNICREHRPDAVSIWQAVSNAESKWDELLVKYGQPIWGYSEDDYHPAEFPSSQLLGSTWIQVPGNPSSTWYGSGGIKEKVAGGNYYISWITRGFRLTGRPPELRVGVDNSGTYPVISADVSNTSGWSYATWFKTDKGRYGGNQYTCNGSEKYVRVQGEVYPGLGKKIQIRSQPIWIDPIDTVGSAMRTPVGRGILSTSPELRLRYLSSSETPTPPDTGYIGRAFEVTTDSGTCPLGATIDLSYDGEDLSAMGGTRYLAIYRYDTASSAWVKVGGTANYGTATITTPITALGYYTISADLPADTTASQVFFDTPPYGGVVSQDTQVKVTLNDDLGAYTVSFYMNDHLLAEDSDALDGWSVNLPYADYCTGDWTLKAIAEDLAGNQGTAEIPIYINSATPRPTVSITSPGAGANLSGTVTVTGTCGDNMTVAAVTLYADDTLIGYGELDGSGGWSSGIDTRLLVNGARSLKAVVEDYPGNEATASRSVTINNATVSVAGAKQIADGGAVGITGLVATAGTGAIGGAFYVEDAGRAAGLRVSTDKTIAQGDMISASGLMSTVDGERTLAGADVLQLSSGNPLPKALAMVGRELGGGAVGYIPGWSGYPLLSNVGLLVCTWGRVTQKGDGYLYLDDGSCRMPDGTLTDTTPNVGIRALCDPTAYNTGDFLIVTGISSCFDAPDGLIARRILTRKPEDVRKVQP